MTSTRWAATIAAVLFCAACGPADDAATAAPAPREGFEARLGAALTAQQIGEPAAALRETWRWAPPAIEGEITELAPIPGGGAVVLLSAPGADGRPLYLGWFDSDGALGATRSLVSGEPESVQLARPGLVATADGTAVLAFSLECSGEGCPTFGGAPIGTGAHLAIFGPDGAEVAHVGLGDGAVQSLAVNDAGEVAVAISRPGGASVRVLDLEGNVLLDLFQPPVGGPISVAFLADGGLVVGRGSTLAKHGADGRVFWRIDAGGFFVDRVVAAGDRIAVKGESQGTPIVAALDGTGALLWGHAVAPPGPTPLAVDPGGAVAFASRTAVFTFDADGSFRATWPGGATTPIEPPSPGPRALAFAHGGLVVGGGTTVDGPLPRAPLLVLLVDEPQGE